MGTGSKMTTLFMFMIMVMMMMFKLSMAQLFDDETSANWVNIAGGHDTECYGSDCGFDSGSMFNGESGGGGATKSTGAGNVSGLSKFDDRRHLQGRAKYISYGALKSDNVPCDQRGQSYYNCQKGQKANPYHRGCTAITRCQRFTG